MNNKKNKKKKKGYVPRPIGKGEMVDVGRTFHTIPSLCDFEKEVNRIAKTKYTIGSHVQVSHGAIYKAKTVMFYQGAYRMSLFLLVKRTVMGQVQYQMARMFLDDDGNEGGLVDLLTMKIKGVQYHMKW